MRAVPGVRVNGDRGRRLPAAANLCFDAVEGEALVIALDLNGVACSTEPLAPRARWNRRTCWSPSAGVAEEAVQRAL